jgi:hypothetical protein
MKGRLVPLSESLEIEAKALSVRSSSLLSADILN